MTERPYRRKPTGSGTQPGEHVRRHLDEMTEIFDDAADLTRRCTFEEFGQRRPYQNEARGIVVHLREVINRLPESYRALHPDIPWQQITGMGNVTAHHYDMDVDWQIVWNALTIRVRELRSRLGL